jgi:hypothetical protein
LIVVNLLTFLRYVDKTVCGCQMYHKIAVILLGFSVHLGR